MRLFWTAAFLALASTPTVAQVDMRSAEAKAAPRTWNITIGFGIGAAPSFLGVEELFRLSVPRFFIGRGSAAAGCRLRMTISASADRGRELARRRHRQAPLGAA